MLISGDTDAQRLLEAERSGQPLLHKAVTLERLREAMTSAFGARQPGRRVARNESDHGE